MPPNIFLTQKFKNVPQKSEYWWFNGGCSPRWNPNQRIGVLIDLLTGYIVSFQIIHHGIENSLLVSSKMGFRKWKSLKKKLLNIY